MLKFAAGVVASRVTVLEFALVMLIKLNVESGALLLDQFEAPDQRPSAVFVQELLPAASAPGETAKARKPGIKLRKIRRKRPLRIN